MLRKLRAIFVQRWFTPFLLAALLVPTVSGRGALARQSASSTTITLLSFNSAPNYAAWYHFVIAQFARTHPGFTVNLRFTDPTHITTLIKVGVAGGQPPDITADLPGAFQTQLFQAHDILDLTPFYQADKQWQSWTKQGWAAVPASQYTYNGHIMATNDSLGPMLVWYWKDILAKYNLAAPVTISDLIHDAAVLNAHHQPVMSIGLSSQALFNYDYTFYTLEANYDLTGAKARQADGGLASWTGPTFTNAGALFLRLYKAGVFDAGALQENYDPDAKLLFRQRKVAMFWPSGPWMDGFFTKAQADDIGVVRFPELTAGEPPILTGSNDLEHNIFTLTAAQRDPKHIALMVAFLKSFDSPASQQELARQGIDPILPSAADTPSTNPAADLLRRQVAVVSASKYVIDENTYTPATAQALDNGLLTVLLGQQSVTQLFSSVDAASRKAQGP